VLSDLVAKGTIRVATKADRGSIRGDLDRSMLRPFVANVGARPAVARDVGPARAAPPLAADGQLRKVRVVDPIVAIR
jgi:hypothetical protein